VGRARLWLAALAGTAAVAAVQRRRRAREREGVEVTYDDGSSVALESGAPAAAELLELARGALRSVDAGR